MAYPYKFFKDATKETLLSSLVIVNLPLLLLSAMSLLVIVKPEE